MSQVICFNKKHIAIFNFKPNSHNKTFHMRWTPLNSYIGPYFNMSFDGLKYDPDAYPNFVEKEGSGINRRVNSVYFKNDGEIGTLSKYININKRSTGGPVPLNSPPDNLPFLLNSMRTLSTESIREYMLSHNALTDGWVVVTSHRSNINAVTILDIIQNKPLDEMIDMVCKIMLTDVTAVTYPQVNYIEIDKLLESIDMFNDVTKHEEILKMWSVKYPGNELTYVDVDPKELDVFSYENVCIRER